MSIIRNILASVALAATFINAGAGNPTAPARPVSGCAKAIMPGDYPDPTILRDGNDYYMTHSAFDYLPGLTVFHSTDLVNWKPVASALTENLGSVWTPDISKHNGKYYIYFTVAGHKRYTTYVVTANDVRGPWSKPVDLNTDKVIDPCHVADEKTGQRWLYLSGGNRIRLSPDGLSTTGTMEHVYSGWRMPADWIAECNAFEGPKVKHAGEYYYYLSAVGGTAGPPTSHSVAVARAKSPDGPWENCPDNPLIHTWSYDEQWWSKGHGSLVDSPDGKLWIVYHAYEKGFHGLGRQTLAEPVRLTEDGWLELTGETISCATADSSADRSLLRNFAMGTGWKFYRQWAPERFSVSGGRLCLRGCGDGPGTSSPLLFVAGEHSYEFRVKVELHGNATAGLTLFYEPGFYVAYGFDGQRSISWKNGRRHGSSTDKSRTLWLRVVNDRQVVSGYRSTDGHTWIKNARGYEVSGYNHNTLNGFLSLLPGLFVFGDGEAVFSEFSFRTL